MKASRFASLFGGGTILSVLVLLGCGQTQNYRREDASGATDKPNQAVTAQYSRTKWRRLERSDLGWTAVVSTATCPKMPEPTVLNSGPTKAGLTESVVQTGAVTRGGTAAPQVGTVDMNDPVQRTLARIIPQVVASHGQEGEPTLPVPGLLLIPQEPVSLSNTATINTAKQLQADAQSRLLSAESAVKREETTKPVLARERPLFDYGQANDYGWLVGKLTYIESKGVWWLRYAPADQEETHGGAVTLFGDDLAATCKNGQIVRVEGDLINPQATEARPGYWVRRIEVLKPAAPMGD
jgi:hypothetical protein